MFRRLLDPVIKDQVKQDTSALSLSVFIATADVKIESNRDTL